jgi:hypothetical protein
MGKRLDTTIIVTAIGDANATAEVELSNTMGNPTIVTAEGKDDVVAVRMAGNVSQTYRLDALHCSVSLPRDLTTKSGPCIGVNGWRVTNETLNGTDLTLDVSRQSPVDLHAGDEIVRIPIRANVALDTVGYVVLKDYSFNADFKGCTPESITPDTVKIVVTPECGDSTIRHFMRTNSIFELLTIEPNPARNEVTVEVRGPGSGVRDPGVKMEIVDVLGNVRLSGTVDPPKTTIDVSSLAAGTYFLRLSEGGEVRTRRFVIAR